MGLTNLYNVLRIYQPNISISPLSSCISKGSFVAIDANYYAYRLSKFTKTHLVECRETQIEQVANNVISMSQAIESKGFVPLWIFDGFKKPLKKRLLELRSEKKKIANESADRSEQKLKQDVEKIEKKLATVIKTEEDSKIMKENIRIVMDRKITADETKTALEAIKNISSDVKIPTKEIISQKEELSKNLKAGFSLSKQHWKRITEKLHLEGYYSLNAPSDADSQLASICKLSLGFPLSNDIDVLAFGSPMLLSPLSESDWVNLKSNLVCRHYRIESVLEAMNAKPEEFLTLCVLLGTDYKVKGLQELPSVRFEDSLIRELVDGICGRIKPEDASYKVKTLLQSRDTAQFHIILKYLKDPLVLDEKYTRSRIQNPSKMHQNNVV